MEHFRNVPTEERMRSIVDHVIDGIITINAAGTIITFNPAAERIFGYRADEVIGANVSLLMPEPDRGRHDAYIANYLRTGEAKIIGIGREVAGLRRDGSTFPMELAISEFALGEHRHFTGIVRDITERKRLEQQLRERVTQLAEADRRKDEFLATLAHELRNPLAPIVNAVTLLDVHGPKEPMLQAARDTIGRQVQHMVRLIDDLLDVSRITRGRLELRKERVAIAVVVEQALETARPHLGHELVVSLPPQPIYVDADPVRLAQVLANLLNNAAKYTPKQGRITLAVEAAGDACLLRVRDTGIGIPPEQLQRVFDMFSQLTPALERSHGGLGIGLALARGLVEMHGGTIEAHSAGRGRGSEFVVRLPGAREPAAGEASAGAHADAVSGKSMLIVEDNADAAQSLALLLRLGGNEAAVAHDGMQGLEQARRLRPDAILLDIGLPGMNGYQVCSAIRAEPWARDVPIFALTGWGQEDDRQKAVAAGFDGHLVKPVDFDALLRSLSAAFRARQRE